MGELSSEGDKSTDSSTVSPKLTEISSSKAPLIIGLSSVACSSALVSLIKVDDEDKRGLQEIELRVTKFGLTTNADAFAARKKSDTKRNIIL